MADFQTRQTGLDHKAAALLAEYRTLLDEIAKSGKHYSEFRRLKETVFALEKIARRNGVQPAKEKPAAGAPNNEQFIRKAAPQSRSAASATANTPPDLFNRTANREKRNTGEPIQNPTPPDIFNRKGRVSEAHPP